MFFCCSYCKAAVNRRVHLMSLWRPVQPGLFDLAAFIIGYPSRNALIAGFT